MLSTANTALQNRILRALPENEFRWLLPKLKPVRLSSGDVLYLEGGIIDYIYFPENSIISTVKYFEDGASLETGITGREGMAGVAVALSNNISSCETNVQAPGDGWKIATDNFREVFESGGVFQDLILSYVFTFFEQVAQSGACINHHPVNKRLARWLLMCHDRTDGDELTITQDFIAQMLGVNRPSVTVAAIQLKDEGLINYSRGMITIVNRPGLVKAACECYKSIKQIYDNYLSLLEIRQMNRRLDSLNGKMMVELRRRNEIQKVTHEHVKRLQQAVGDIRNPPARVRVCRQCQRLCDFRNKPLSRNNLMGKRITAEFVPVICTVCQNF